MDATPAGGPQVAGADGDRRFPVQGLAEGVERQGLDVDLHIGGRVVGARPDEGPHVRGGHGHGPLAEQGVFQRHQRTSPDIGIERVHGRHAAHPVVGPDLQVVLQVLAHPRAVGPGLDAQGLQTGPVADAAEFQQLGRADGPGAEHHLRPGGGVEGLAVPTPLDPCGATVLDPDPGHMHPADQGQVRAVQDRLQEGGCRAPAHAPALGHVEIGAARIVAAVEVPDRGDAGLGRRLGKGVQHLPAHGGRLHPKLTPRAVGGARRVDVVLLADEVRQDIVPAPAHEPQLPPAVIVRRLAAHVDHGIDGGRAADHPPPRIGDAAPGQARVRLGPEHPVRAGIADGEQVAHGNVQPDPVVLAPRLEQQHPVPRIGGQPVGQNAAGRPGPHDDVVEGPEGRAGRGCCLFHAPA